MSEDTPQKPVVLLVMAGDYDDWGVSGVFSEDHVAAAERHSDLVGGEIVRRELNPTLEDPGQDFWCVDVTAHNKWPRLQESGELQRSYSNLRGDAGFSDEIFTWHGYAENEAAAIIEAGKALTQAQQEKEREAQC